MPSFELEWVEKQLLKNYKLNELVRFVAFFGIKSSVIGNKEASAFWSLVKVGFCDAINNCKFALYKYSFIVGCLPKTHVRPDFALSICTECGRPFPMIFDLQIFHSFEFVGRY
jgi:hypothetical protein